MRLGKIAPWIGGGILGFDVWRWSMMTLDRISRWETFIGLKKYLPFTDNIWFVPLTMVLGFMFITIAARAELHDAINATKSLVLTPGHDKSGPPRIRERFWKIPLTLSIGAIFLAGISSIVWLWNYLPAALPMVHASIKTPEPIKSAAPPKRIFEHPPITVTNNATQGIANSGTIGQATVINNGPIERHLSQHQQDALKLLASSFPASTAQYLTVESSNDAECETYASEILNILSDSNRVKNKGGLILRFVEDDPSIRGVLVLVTDRNDVNFTYAQQLANVLNSNDAPVRFSTATRLKPGEFKVVVLRAPAVPPAQRSGK